MSAEKEGLQFNARGGGGIEKFGGNICTVGVKIVKLNNKMKSEI
jgi:hypothetical protein